MSTTDHLDVIVGELVRNRRGVDPAGLDALSDAVLAARHVFVAGSGRSGVAIRGFANRLGHLGRPTSVVGEITCPRSRPGDLLVVGSGSGETHGPVALADRARAGGLSLAVVTTAAESTLGRAADHLLVLPGATKSSTADPRRSGQPMGSAFEQLSGLVYDAVVLELMHRTGQTSADLLARHADLE
ncbi:6-phospho-3-hexuloisomerase [Pseudonocardia alni]|uniref:6-phospho-3-hexuloisomerase n=1 Tax=Pseudonocardia alni TaxID=33907 RepID=UPI0033E883C3